MGQKVHPRGLRLGIIEDWQSSWYVKSPKEFAKHVHEDEQIRRFLLSKLKAASVSSVLIQRKGDRVVISIVTGRSGVVIGRGGQNLDALRTEIMSRIATTDVRLEVLEVEKVDADAALVAQSIAQQLEKRVAFRRTMKQAIQKAMRANAKGIKIMISGRLAGADIARTEWSKEGRIPLHTFKAGIQYAHAEAMTLFGIIGVKVWIYTGDCDTTILTRHNIVQVVVVRLLEIRAEERHPVGMKRSCISNVP
jgi:small subunit ribosomal protein S3